MATRGTDAGPAVMAIHCPHCGAKPRQRCTSTYGGETVTHAARKRAATADATTPPAAATA